MDYHGRSKGPPGIPDVLSGKGGTADIPCGGVPTESGDGDGNAGALCAPECPQHRGDAGGRNPPLPTVLQVRHEGPQEGAERAAPGDRAVPQGGGEEETAAEREGDKAELGAGVRSVRGANQKRIGIQIPGENPDGDGRRLAGSGWKPRESKEKLGASVQGAQQGGRRPKGVKGVLLRRDPGGVALWVRDVGVNGKDGESPGQLPVQDREEDHREAAAMKEVWELGIPAVGGSNEGDGDGGDKDTNYPEAEYGCAIHCDAADSEPVRTGQPAARRAGVSTVMGTDGDRLEGRAGEGSGSNDRTGNGGRFGGGVRGRTGRGGGVPGSERVQ